MNPDLTLRLPQADLARHAEELARAGRVRIGRILAADTARMVHDELLASRLWSRAMRQGKTERRLDPEQLATLEPRHLEAIERLAREGAEDAFRFLHDAIRIPPGPEERQRRGMTIDHLAEALESPAALEQWRALTGDWRISRLSVEATRYLPGHFLTSHDDGRRDDERVFAVVFNFTARWNPDWGGLLQFHDESGDIAGGLMPRFNTLHIFRVPQVHSVSMVSPLAPVPRLSLAGWLLR